LSKKTRLPCRPHIWQDTAVSEWLYEHLARIAAWLPSALVAIAVALVAALIATGRRPGAAAPSRARRIGRSAAFGLLSLMVIGLVVAYWPMAALFRPATRMELTLGRPVPDMPFHRLADDAQDRLANLRGRAVFVNLWATWCPPCDEELRTLDRLQQEFGPRGLVVLTLSDEARAQQVPFVAERAPHAIAGRVDSFGWLATVRDFRPYTLFIDRQGVLRDFVFGSQDYATFARKAAELLE
jgi:thiol-disulfide isomerase/thioredoxin